MISEASRDNFVRLAEKRVSKAMHDIKLISKLANRHSYSYTHEDAEKIHDALKSAIDEVRDTFENSGVSPKEIFKL